MSTTNDPQALYSRLSDCCGEEIHHGHCTRCEKPCSTKPTERKPLLSDEQVVSEIRNDDGTLNCFHEMTGEEVRDFYENLITSGELRVVKKATNVWDGINAAFTCSLCRSHAHNVGLNFCPGCGAEIQKP